MAKGDSAASGNYFTVQDAHVLLGVKREQGPLVTLPDNDVISSTQSGHLPTPDLPPLATKTAILPRLASSSLVSLPQLCDNGCQVLLTSTDLHDVKNGKFVLDNNQGHQVLHGTRNAIDRLWDIEVPNNPTTAPPPEPSINHNSEINSC